MPAKGYRRAEPMPPPKDLTPTEQVNQDLELFDSENQSLEAKAMKVLPHKVFLALKRIAHYVAKVGMSIEESCLLVDIEPEKFKHYMEAEPIVKKIITMKTLAYKRDMMTVISAKARAGDEDLAMSILTKRFPDEFGNKKNPQGNGDQDVFFQAIRFIRKNGDSKPLVHEASGQSVVVTHKSASEGRFERIGDILGGDVSARFNLNS